MIKEPNFEYNYDLAFRKSFAARLSFAILLIAAGVFLAVMLIYLFAQQERIKEETALKARTQLHDAVMHISLEAVKHKATGDTLTDSEIIRLLQAVQPYEHSFTLLTDAQHNLTYTSNQESTSRIPQSELQQIIKTMASEKSGMKEVLKDKNTSLLIYEHIKDCGRSAAVVCSRTDILLEYKPLILNGFLAFILGLSILFTASTLAIYKMVRPLHLFAESAISIAEGNLDASLPEIQSEDELMQLRKAFEYMQDSLKKYIEDLKVTMTGKERLQSELTIAHDIQMGMIPTIFPERDDLDLFASMSPAKEVGGDLYDFVIEGDEVFFIIGDVAGKGVPASLYMAVTRTLFRNLAGNYQSAANIVREMNHAIASDNESMVFVTIFVGVLDLRTHHLTFCNAAHNAPAIVTPDGNCRLLEVETNLPIGIDDHYGFEEQQIPFPEGTSLLLYTDGLTEAMYISADGNRKLFGEERLLHDLDKNKNSSGIEIIDYLKQHVSVFADGTEQSDDLTLLYLHHGSSVKNNSLAPRRIIMKNEISEISRMREFFLSVCREHNIEEEEAKSLHLAIEEWVANVINYAYPKGTRGHVELTLRVVDNEMAVMVKDHGVAFDPTEYAEADIDSDLEDRPIGGLGIYLTRSIMDTMNYERSADGYNILRLTKKLGNNT